MNVRVFDEHGPWLFGRGTDLAVFGGSALASLALVAVGHVLGLLDAEAPTWIFLTCIVAVDVAHVWSTGFRVYFDVHELKTRPFLYFGVPVLVFGVGVCVHALGAFAFWRVLAYVAAFHFVRQQVGWMRLYGRRNTHETSFDHGCDTLTVYAVTVAPLVYWHAHLPRRFAWFLQGDFLPGLAPWVGDVALWIEHALLMAFAARQLVLWRRHTVAPGKSLLVMSTYCAWNLGIVVFDSDYVFTVTNVLVHGIPYMALTYRHARAVGHACLARRIAHRGFSSFFAFCFGLACLEELGFHRWVFGDYPELFGAHVELTDDVLVWLVPLLALPQMTHYVLDGFVWRVRSENPVLRRELDPS